MKLGEVGLLTNDVIRLAVRPWGATNMSFYDPDCNIIYLRSFSK